MQDSPGLATHTSSGGRGSTSSGSGIKRPSADCPITGTQTGTHTGRRRRRRRRRRCCCCCRRSNLRARFRGALHVDRHGCGSRRPSGIHIPILFPAQQHLPLPSSEYHKLLAGSDDGAVATGDDGGCTIGVDEVGVLVQFALHRHFHEHEVTACQALGEGDEGGSDGGKGFGDADAFVGAKTADGEV